MEEWSISCRSERWEADASVSFQEKDAEEPAETGAADGMGSGPLKPSLRMDNSFLKGLKFAVVL